MAAHSFSLWRMLSFVVLVWTFCFTYTAIYVPENWVDRAHLLVPEEHLSHDIALLSEGERVLLGVNVATLVTCTALFGFLLNVLHRQPFEIDLPGEAAAAEAADAADAVAAVAEAERQETAGDSSCASTSAESQSAPSSSPCSANQESLSGSDGGQSAVAAANARAIAEAKRRKIEAVVVNVSLWELLQSYALIGAVVLLYGAVFYLWCFYSYEHKAGMAYFMASRMFTSGSTFARVSAGFFSSILLLSYLDTFGLRANLGIRTPTGTSPVNRALSILALTGLGGLGGVAGASVMIVSDLFWRALALMALAGEALYAALGDYTPTAVGVVVGSVSLLAAYKIYFRPTYAVTRDTFNRKSAAFEATRRRLFPNPYPNGWYGLCRVEELAGGNIKSISCLGLDLVAFQGEDGAVGVLDAFCPHIGAHLGQGGRVVGSTIECPFHHWRFDASGKCVEIPYSPAPVPAMCKTKSWHTRVWGGMVFLWFDAEGRDPTYEMSYPKEIDTGEFYYGGTTQLEFDQHVSEMADNAPDEVHFSTLHKALPIPVLGRFLWVDHKVRLRHETDPAKKHLIYFDNDAAVFCGSQQLVPRSVMHVTFEGPAVVYFRMSMPPMGDIFVCKTILPLAPFHQYTEDRWWASNGVPRWLGTLLAYIAKNALEQDREVWENKIYRRRPMLVKGDGPFGAFRRWYSQFYSEHSKDVGQNLMDW